MRDIAPHLPELHADRGACRQILLNLLSNAVKFTPRGGLITVQARRDGEMIILSVRDTGSGVPALELPRLVEPFFRGTSAGACAAKGTGLGLTIVRELVSLHGGRIDLASRPGEGLCAAVSLPIEARCRAEPPRVQILPRPGAGLPPKRDGQPRHEDGARAKRTG
jgi:cell cycle sensor histidine kinase DivJ